MAFNAQVLRNASFQIQTALGSDITITGITNASEAVITASNSLSNDDLVVLSGVVGMPKLNGRVVRVSSVSGTEFTAKGLDTTLTTYWGTYGSGGVGNEVSGFSAFTTVTGIDVPDGSPDEIDLTTIDADSKQIAFGHDAIIKGTVSVFADPALAATTELILAARLRTPRVFKLVTQSGGIYIFNATNVSGGSGFSGNLSSAATQTINVTLAYPMQGFVS